MGKTTRVVLCGLRKVGKTAIVEQLIYGNINKSTELHSTIEDIYVANIETDRGAREKIRFYDTCGLDQPLPNAPQGSRDHPQLPKMYFGLADGYVLVYDTDRPDSLDALISLKKDIDKYREKKEVTIIVLGNRIKSTETGTLENTASKAAHWAAREKLRHFEVNAMERQTLYEPFVYLASRLNPPPNKSAFPQLSMVRKSITRPDTSWANIVGIHMWMENDCFTYATIAWTSSVHVALCTEQKKMRERVSKLKNRGNFPALGAILSMQKILIVDQPYCTLFS